MKSNSSISEKPLGDLTNSLVSKKTKQREKSLPSSLRVRFSQEDEEITHRKFKASRNDHHEDLSTFPTYQSKNGPSTRLCHSESDPHQRIKVPYHSVYKSNNHVNVAKVAATAVTNIENDTQIECVLQVNQRDVDVSALINQNRENPYDAAFCAAYNSTQDQSKIDCPSNNSLRFDIVNPLHRPPRRFRSSGEESFSGNALLNHQIDRSTNTTVCSTEGSLYSYNKEINSNVTVCSHDEKEEISFHKPRLENTRAVPKPQPVNNLGTFARLNMKMWNFIESKLSCNDYKDMIYEEYEVKVFEHE